MYLDILSLQFHSKNFVFSTINDVALMAIKKGKLYKAESIITHFSVFYSAFVLIGYLNGDVEFRGKLLTNLVNFQFSKRTDAMPR